MLSSLERVRYELVNPAAFAKTRSPFTIHLGLFIRRTNATTARAHGEIHPYLISLVAEHRLAPSPSIFCIPARNVARTSHRNLAAANPAASVDQDED